jgi:signal transduction histidine kinase
VHLSEKQELSVLLRDKQVATSARPPEWLAALVGAAMLLLMYLWRDVWAVHFALPIGYGAPLIIVAWFRSRRVLWAVAGGFALLAIYKFFIVRPVISPAVQFEARSYDFVSGMMVLVDLLLVAIIAHVWINTQRGLERQNAQLESANSDLVAREEEIARQNEELQSQTEELERQSEELRVANEELAQRERTLQILLTLSRSLATQMSRDEMLSRICETLGDLVNGPDVASAVLEQEGNEVVVRCHYGFGPQGLENERFAFEKSFLALVLSRDRTGYLEDIALRPDLVLPQPIDGQKLVAVLAAPLRVQGKPVGTVEVYSRHRTSWSDQQIALVESIAAQTSVSLEAADLFDAMSRERQRFETVLRTVPLGLAVGNSDCSDIRVNPAGSAIMSVPPDINVAGELAQRAWQFFYQGQPLPLNEFPLLRACRQGTDVMSQEIEILAGERRLTLLVNARPIRDVQGKLLGAVCAFVDITALKELQRELDLRRREAEEASVRKTRFLAAVSHDIRTPANAISLLAELIRRSSGNPAMAADVPELAMELHHSAMSLVNLLGDVLDVARFDSGRIELEESEFDLNQFLQDEIRQLQPLARQKSLEMSCSLPARPLRIRTDRIKLSRIIGNLVGNAIKFTERGQIRLEAQSQNGQGVEIRISDTGVGIATEFLRHIFDEFFQLRNPERDRTKGTGLGLSICKRLVDAMGGRIDVVSQPGAGSTFTVTLPASAVLPMPGGGASL